MRTLSHTHDALDLVRRTVPEVRQLAAEGKRAPDVTGEDVVAYYDAQLGDANPMDRYLEKCIQSDLVVRSPWAPSISHAEGRWFDPVGTTVKSDVS